MAQADAMVLDGTAFAARATDEHRRTRHGGGIRRRKHHKVFIAAALGPGERTGIVAIATAGENAGDAPSFVPLAEIAGACGAPRPGTHVLADRAHATRETMPWCAGDAPSFVPLAEIAGACGAPRPGTHVLADRAHATRETMPWCAGQGRDFESFSGMLARRMGHETLVGLACGILEWLRVNAVHYQTMCPDSLPIPDLPVPEHRLDFDAMLLEVGLTRARAQNALELERREACPPAQA